MPLHLARISYRKNEYMGSTSEISTIHLVEARDARQAQEIIEHHYALKCSAYSVHYSVVTCEISETLTPDILSLPTEKD